VTGSGYTNGFRYFVAAVEALPLRLAARAREALRNRNPCPMATPANRTRQVQGQALMRRLIGLALGALVVATIYAVRPVVEGEDVPNVACVFLCPRPSTKISSS